MTKDLVIGFGAISAVLAVGGPLVTGLAMTRLAFGGVSSVLGGAGTGGGLISTVKAFGGGLTTLAAAAAPLLAMLGVAQ